MVRRPHIASRSGEGLAYTSERGLRKLQALAAETPNVHFVGRVGTYRYYNMDQVVAQALTLFAKLTGQSRREALANPASW